MDYNHPNVTGGIVVRIIAVCDLCEDSYEDTIFCKEKNRVKPTLREVSQLLDIGWHSEGKWLCVECASK